jgi:PASTA domain
MRIATRFMRGSFRFILLGLTAAVVLALSPGASGDGGQPTIVALGQQGTGYVLNYQSLGGVITHSVPAPSNMGTAFVPAANGSIVFTEVGENNSTGIGLIRPDGTTIELDAAPGDDNPSISYDGSKVVFERVAPANGGWTSDIYVINADGTGLKLVASGAGKNFLRLPQFSPDGRSIIYWCAPSDGSDNQSRNCGPLTDGSYRNSGVMRINADGSNPRMIVIGGGDAIEPGGPTELSWSPDGQWILLDGSLTVHVPAGWTGQQELFAYHADGSDLFNNADPSRQVTHETDPWGPSDGQFCGNSTQIVFNKVVDDNGNSGNYSYAINRDGTNRRQIFLSALGLPYGVCVLPVSGEAPPPLVDATHITVPSLRALGVKAARRQLRADNLTVGRLIYRYSAAVRKNRVLSQHPKAGAIAHRTQKVGPNVSLVVSRGRHR